MTSTPYAIIHTESGMLMGLGATADAAWADAEREQRAAGGEWDRDDYRLDEAPAGYTFAAQISGGIAVAALAGPTAEDITDEQIEALRAEAAEAGDLLRVAICDVALSSGITEVADVEDHRAELEALGIIPEHVDADVRARAECARVIAEAQEDDDIVAGCTVQYDPSGQGHAWRAITRDTAPEPIRVEIECEILDGGRESCDDYVASNGLHYRWS